LFREFAGIDFSVTKAANAQKILSFASDYGCIIELPCDYHPLRQEQQWDRKPTTLKEWFRASEHLSMAVDLWTLINTQGIHARIELESRMERNKGFVAYRWSHQLGVPSSSRDWFSGKLLGLRARNPNDLSEKEKRELAGLEKASREQLETRSRVERLPIAVEKEAARWLNASTLQLAQRTLREVINKALTDHEKPCRTLTIPAPDMRLVRLPENLLSYMWLCFARVVAGEIEERPCEMFDHCKKYLYIGHGPGLQRSDATLCSPVCRQRKRRYRDG